VNHRATSRFWAAYYDLSPELQAQADKQFKLLKADPRHPSLHFKQTGRVGVATLFRVFCVFRG
jgi:hypothetical protein